MLCRNKGCPKNKFLVRLYGDFLFTNVTICGIIFLLEVSLIAIDLTKAVEDRQQYVIKSNEIIQQYRYDLTTQQHRMLLYMISMIKPTDTGDEIYEMNIANFCAAVNLNLDDGGTYYHRLKAEMENLAKIEGKWIKKDDGSQRGFAWLSNEYLTINEGSGVMSFKFHKEAAPYLFELKANYTEYRLEDVLPFKRKYSIRLYELIQSYSYKGRAKSEDGLIHGKPVMVQTITLNFELEAFKKQIDAETYDRWVDLKRKALEPAIEEINKYSVDFTLRYEPITQGKRVTAVQIYVTPQTARGELDARHNRREAFGE